MTTANDGPGAAMRRAIVAEAVPWLSAAEGGDGHAHRLAALIRASAKPAGLSPLSRLRIWARLSRRRNAAIDRRNLLRLRWAVAAVALLTGGGIVGAVSAHRWWPPAAAEIDEIPAKSAHPPRRPPGMPKARATLPGVDFFVVGGVLDRSGTATCHPTRRGIRCQSCDRR